MNLNFIKKYYQKGILIDTNLLLLLLVGKFDVDLIEKNNGLSRYTKQDYEILNNFVNKFKLFIITPHILTEISNLSHYISEPKLSGYLNEFVNQLIIFRERNIAKNDILKEKLFTFLGVTDTAIIKIAKSKDYLVLTDDLKQFIQLQNQKVNSINFNHIRDYYFS